MFRYKIFAQLSDHSFLEVAQTMHLEDAELVYGRYTYAMISEVGGEIVQTKLMPTDQPTLI